MLLLREIEIRLGELVVVDAAISEPRDPRFIERDRLNLWALLGLWGSERSSDTQDRSVPADLDRTRGGICQPTHTLSPGEPIRCSDWHRYSRDAARLFRPGFITPRLIHYMAVRKAADSTAITTITVFSLCMSFAAIVSCVLSVTQPDRCA